MGGKDIFLEDSKYKSALITNDNCEEVLPKSHKKDFWLNDISKTLKDALIMFALSNVIRDLRGNENTHRSMLVNISRFIKMHSFIMDFVQGYFNILLNSYFTYTYGKPPNNDEILLRTECIYNEQYAPTNKEYMWYDVKCKHCGLDVLTFVGG